MKKCVAILTCAAALLIFTPKSADAVCYGYCPPPKGGGGGGGGGGSWAPAVPIGCAGFIILRALAVNHRENRELTKEEVAWSCPILLPLVPVMTDYRAQAKPAVVKAKY